MGREIMTHRLQVFLLMDVGNISMLVEDNDLNNSFDHGEIFPHKIVHVDCWIYFLYLYFLMLEPVIYGSILPNKIKSMVEARVSQLGV